MGKVLNHPLRAMGAALTVVGAAIAFFVFFVPLAAADRIHPGGKGGSSKGSPGTNEAWWYADNNGNQVLHSLSLDEPFSIVGKNLNEVLGPEGNFSIQCWNGHFFTIVSNWEYGPDSRSLVNVDLNNDCVDKQGETSVRVRYRTSQISKGVQYVALPTVPVKG
jgi:hypothetical protein